MNTTQDEPPFPWQGLTHNASIGGGEVQTYLDQTTGWLVIDSNGILGPVHVLSVNQARLLARLIESAARDQQAWINRGTS